MAMLRTASRKRVKIKMQIGGTAGSGKTMGALKLAYGITKDWNKIAVIDTENGSSELYVGKEGIGSFQIIDLKSFTEKDFIKAIKECEAAGIEVCIIDSSTRLWDYLLELQTKLGGTYKDWKEPKEKHKQYLYTLLQADMHIISTVRKKEEFIIEQEAGKKATIKKVGLKDQQEGNMTYEFTLVFEVDRDSHLTVTSKDRTGLFEGQPPFLISEETGEKIKQWCLEGDSRKDTTEQDIAALVPIIDAAPDLASLVAIWKENGHLHSSQGFKDIFSRRKAELKENA